MTEINTKIVKSKFLLVPILLFLFALSFPITTFCDDTVEDGYSQINYGTTSDAVLQVQIRLKELGYFSENNVLTPSVYDKSMQMAVELFCQQNSVTYSGNGISPELQSIIFANDSLEYQAPEEEKLSLSVRFADYMKHPSKMFGGAVPVFAVWIIGTVLLLFALFLFIWLFLRGDSKPEFREISVMTPPHSWQKRANQLADLERMTQDQFHMSLSDNRVLDIQVTYGRSVRNIKCTCSHPIDIGRNQTIIPLDPSDGNISRNHFTLQFVGAVLVLTDHSANGTYVNEHCVQNCQLRINSGDRIIVGKHMLLVRF